MSLRTAPIAVAVLATAAIPAGLALAAAQQYNGPAGTSPNAGVEFGAKLAGGKPSAVRRFEFHNLPAQCAGGAGAATGGLAITMRVSARRTFHGTGAVDVGHATATVKGTFARGFAKASGTVRVSGAGPGCAQLDTGVVHWTARKVGH
jgi:hypothetical protein